ncbi:MAG: membrane-bound lytic murein transglycosylase D [Maribacter sp.]|jgi:membrane-bound lytic murein transglycosylase D
MRKVFMSFSLVGFFFVLFILFSSYTDAGGEKNLSHPQTKAKADGSLAQIIQTPPIPSSADFCGEALPMEHFDVKERLDRELIANSYRHSGTILYLKKSSKYFPTIEKILAEEGMPDDLKYLAVAESGLSNAKSPVGAKGYWQFMKGTGKEYGLTVNSEIDERLHLEKSTRAACKFLRKLNGRFGSYTFAAAAYNMGGPNLNKYKTSQKANDYYDLNINGETMRYVFRIVAIKEIMKNPRNYGFYIDDYQKYSPLPETYDVEVKGAVANWADFALKYGMSYRELKLFNPWIVDSKLTNSQNKTYYVKVPK